MFHRIAPCRNDRLAAVVARVVRKTLLVVLCLVAMAAGGARASDSVLPLDEVRKGMTGYGLTVLEGTEPVRFDVEVMGVLRQIGPGQDLILARVTSENIRQTGIVAGMSGSPIYVDGRVVGALAYAWQFAREPIAGITPIEQMLRIGDRGTAVPGGGVPAGTSKASADVFMKLLLEGDDDARWASIMAPFGSRGGLGASGAMPITTPVSFAGFESSTIERFTAAVGSDRLMAVAAGTSGGRSETGTSSDVFRAGDAFSALLVDGDFTLAANGTVTYVSEDKVYGFGHPFLDMGAVDLPMAKAEVVGVLPNIARSFKFSNTGKVVGALRQDRLPGVLGVSNAEASMVPVTVEVGTPGSGAVYSFRLARSPELFPALLAFTTDSIVAGTQKAAGERTVVVDVDMKLKDAGSVTFRDGWAGMQARQAIPAYLGIVSQYLLANEFGAADVESVRISLSHAEELRMVRIVDATVEDPTDGVVSPGDEVRLRATLKPYRGEPFVETFAFRIPTSQPAGRALMFVGGGALLNRLDFALVPAVPTSFDQILEVIGRLRASTELGFSLYTPIEGAVTSGAYHPALPPSMKAVIDGDTSHSLRIPVRFHPSVRGARQLDQIVDGVVRVDVDVKPRL
jgi:hypothetical protein